VSDVTIEPDDEDGDAAAMRSRLAVIAALVVTAACLALGLLEVWRSVRPARRTTVPEGRRRTATAPRRDRLGAGRRREARQLGAEVVALSDVDTRAMPGAGTAPSHDLARYAYVLEKVRGSLLDVGCGRGVFLDAYQGGPKAGVDLTPLPDADWPSYVADAAALPFPDRSWDTVSAQEMLEHQPDDRVDVVLAELRRVARERVLITVPFLQHQLGSGHLQRFDAERLSRMFPTASFTILDKETGRYPWVLIEEVRPPEAAPDASAAATG
jgi:SAM-dependent methyltransferase